VATPVVPVPAGVLAPLVAAPVTAAVLCVALPAATELGEHPTLVEVESSGTEYVSVNLSALRSTVGRVWL